MDHVSWIHTSILHLPYCVLTFTAYYKLGTELSVPYTFSHRILTITLSSVLWVKNLRPKEIKSLVQRLTVWKTVVLLKPVLCYLLSHAKVPRPLHCSTVTSDPRVWRAFCLLISHSSHNSLRFSRIVIRESHREGMDSSWPFRMRTIKKSSWSMKVLMWPLEAHNGCSVNNHWGKGQMNRTMTSAVSYVCCVYGTMTRYI